MRVTFHGQSSLTVEPAGTRLFFDPFLWQNELAKDVDLDAIRADGIFLTHRRFDQVADAVDLAGRTVASVIANGQAGHRLDF